MIRWWPAARATLVTLAMVLGLVDGCPLKVAGKREVLEPFRVVTETAKFQQRWSMFRGAPPSRYRLLVEARAGADAPWELLFRAGDDDGPLTDKLTYRRVRGAWNPSGSKPPRGAYPSFASWVAREIFAMDARYTEVRVHFERVLLSRGVETGTGELVYEQRRRRP